MTKNFLQSVVTVTSHLLIATILTIRRLKMHPLNSLSGQEAEASFLCKKLNRALALIKSVVVQSKVQRIRWVSRWTTNQQLESSLRKQKATQAQALIMLITLKLNHKVVPFLLKAVTIFQIKNLCLDLAHTPKPNHMEKQLPVLVSALQVSARSKRRQTPLSLATTTSHAQSATCQATLMHALKITPTFEDSDLDK